MLVSLGSVLVSDRQATTMLTEVGTGTDHRNRHEPQKQALAPKRITETGTDHKNGNRHRNRKNFPAPTKTKRPSSNCYQALVYDGANCAAFWPGETLRRGTCCRGAELRCV